MQLVCIDVKGVSNITYGKTYEVVKLQSGRHSKSNKPLTGLFIVDDTNNEKYVSSRRFTSLSNWREIQLQNLNIWIKF